MRKAFNTLESLMHSKIYDNISAPMISYLILSCNELLIFDEKIGYH